MKSLFSEMSYYTCSAVVIDLKKTAKQFDNNSELHKQRTTSTAQKITVAVVKCSAASSCRRRPLATQPPAVSSCPSSSSLVHFPVTIYQQCSELPASIINFILRVITFPLSCFVALRTFFSVLISCASIAHSSLIGLINRNCQNLFKIDYN